MVRKDKRNRGKLEFGDRGRRRTLRSGLYYRSKCGGFALYKSDQLYGVKIDPVRWIAFTITDGIHRVIGRHFSRKSAEKSCEKFDKSHTE